LDDAIAEIANYDLNRGWMSKFQADRYRAISTMEDKAVY